jgi:hypothetical protein
MRRSDPPFISGPSNKRPLTIMEQGVMEFDHPNLKGTSVVMRQDKNGVEAHLLTLNVDIDPHGESIEARQLQGIARHWLRHNPTGTVEFKITSP